MFTQNDLIDLVSKLVEIDSANTWLLPGSAGEKNAQLFMQNYLKALGLESIFEVIDDEHSNLIAVVKGTGGGKAITLYAHADTVGYALWADRALKPSLDGDRLTGLGSADDKGHCAAILMVVKEIIESGIKLSGDLNVCFIADEEGASCGTFDYVNKHKPSAVLVLEAAPLQNINVTHQGFGWLKIKVKGRAAHGSAPDVGIDAIAQMAEVIVRMQMNQRELFAKNTHPLNGETVYHTGTIRGGTDFATYPDQCELGIEIGTQPGETMADRIHEIESIFTEVKNMYPNFSGSVEAIIERTPFETKGTEDLFGILADEIENKTGIKAIAVGDNSWGDAQIFQDAGFPTLGVGAMGDNLHAPEEWVSISDLEKLVHIVTAVVKRYCA
jgi:acetylornithine deacetylase/succinyl-diaminopimelate desuccinylase-like protein